MGIGSFNTNENPATTIGGVTAATLTAAVGAVLVLLEAFDLYDVSDSQYAAVGVFVAAMWAVIAPMVLSIRGIAYAPTTVEEIKTTLVSADPNSLTAGEKKAMAK